MNGPLVQLYCKKLTTKDLPSFVAARPDHVGWQVNLRKTKGDALEDALRESEDISSALRSEGIASVFLLHPSTDAPAMAEALHRVRPDIFLASAERSLDALAALRASGAVPSIMIPIGIPDRSEGIAGYSPREEAKRLGDVADWFTSDTITADDAVDRFGCSGRTSDWRELAAMVKASSLPVVAAGGLDASNVAALWKLCRPAGFDAHTSVCSDGRPDADKARRFVEAVRSLS